MKKEEKYLIELTPTQICELLEWHKSHVGKYRRMGVKEEYLKFHKDCNLACYLRDSYDQIREKEITYELEADRISQLKALL